MFLHVFAQTTHVVAAPHGFACVVIPETRLYIPSFIEIRSGVSEPRGVKIWPFPLLWLVAFTTACTTVQAVIVHVSYFIDTDVVIKVSMRNILHDNAIVTFLENHCIQLNNVVMLQLVVRLHLVFQVTSAA